MGNARHLLLEEISALADGELTPLQLRIAREHVSQCASCSGTLARFTQLERDLQQPPVLTCAGALPLINASADGEAEAADASAARRHLQLCRDCRVDSIMWATVGASIRMLPHGSPSARVDKVIAQLGRRRAPSAVIPAFAARGLVAVTAVLAIVLTSLTRGAAPQLPAA
ncbi:MAG: zf-HC2 domain-containing protein, partial [Chloroflexota bacterium]|nr:zf-HC2 domain-containing protein [Chloroflexota bacterium]